MSKLQCEVCSKKLKHGRDKGFIQSGTSNRFYHFMERKGKRYKIRELKTFCSRKCQKEEFKNAR